MGINPRPSCNPIAKDGIFFSPCFHVYVQPLWVMTDLDGVFKVCVVSKSSMGKQNTLEIFASVKE